MYKGKTILAVIPARGHNDNIDQLNLKTLAGKPLISYTIQAANQSKYIDHVIVSTEDENIASLVEKLGASVPFLRPMELIKSGITTLEVVSHVLKNIKNQYDITIILLPNAPFRGTNIIDKAIEYMIKNKYKKVQGITNKKDYYLYKNDKKYQSLNSLLGGEKNSFSELYTIGGGIYIYRTDILLKDDEYKNIEFGNFSIHEHNSRLIRSLYDLLLAERLIKIEESLVDSLINST